MNDADRLLQEGYALFDAKRHADAYAAFARAAALRPDDAAAWNAQGVVLRTLARFKEAATAYRRALDIRPDFAAAWSNLGNALKDACDSEEALAAHRRAVELEPANAGFAYNLGIALAFAGRAEEALAVYDHALTLRPDDPEILWDRARVLLQMGDYARGWTAYESRWGLPDHHPRPFTQPEWDGKRFKDRLLLFGEQGFGDIIQCARFIPLVKRLGGTVVVECQSGLAPLIQGMNGVDEVAIKDHPLPPFDRRFALLSLPRLFADTVEKAAPAALPYMRPPPERHAKFAKALAQGEGRLKVGIVWSGSVTFKGNRHRAASLAAFLHYLDLPGVRLFSLQKGPPEADLKVLDPEGRRVVDLAPLLDDFADTAAVIEQLDLVVMTDSSVAHLTGALGRPVWVLLGASPHWLWLRQREDSPWYPTMRLFRQKKPGDWHELFQRVRSALAERAGVSVEAKPPLAEASPAGAIPGRINVLGRARDGTVLFNQFDRYIGRAFAAYGEYGAGEHALFEKLVQPGDTVVDAGANMGAHSLFLARLVGPRGTLHAFEPQRVVFQLLAANMALNDVTWAHCHHAALGAEPGFAAIPPLDYATLNNFGGLSLAKEGQGETVPVRTLDSLRLKACRLVKIDVEGMEANVIRGATDLIQRQRPILYVENDRRPNSARLIGLLLTLGYRLWWHLPPLFNPNNFAGNKTNIFGNVVSVNMLCLPAERGGTVQGLREITSPEDWWRAD